MPSDMHFGMLNVLCATVDLNDDTAHPAHSLSGMAPHMHSGGKTMDKGMDKDTVANRTSGIGVSHADNDGAEKQHNDDAILKAIEQEGKDRTQNTMVGKLAHFMRSMGPMTVDQCTHELRNHYDELRKPDGTKYKGSLEKAINGTLYSTGVFERHDNKRWTIKESSLASYEDRVQKKFEVKSKKRKTLSKDGDSRLVARSTSSLPRAYNNKTVSSRVMGQISAPRQKAKRVDDTFKPVDREQRVVQLLSKLAGDMLVREHRFVP